MAENEFGKLERVFYVTVEVPIQWSSFGPWSTCSVSCGPSGVQYRSRVCLLTNGNPAQGDDYKCVGENVEMRKCNRLPCPVNGVWGKFSKWSKCPECVSDTEPLPVFSKRSRKCDSPAASSGGLECSGSETEEVECKVSFCPVNGGWSAWSEWSACGRTCGISHRMRKRFCNNPSPKHNGSYCEGENVEYEECQNRPCINEKLKKSFSADDEEDLEELSNETRDKYGEVAEFEFKDEGGVPRSFQFSKHREVEYSPPSKEIDGFKIPKIKVTLDTFKPISEETYRQHLASVNRADVEQNDESTSDEDVESVELEGPKPRPRTCLTGFYFNHDNNQCEDINECLDRRLSNCKPTERCFNTLGSFRCVETTRRPKKRL